MFVFIARQIFHEIICFFRRWYLEKSEQFWSGIFYFLAGLDKTFAVSINARLWFQPLFGDYSPVGRILGPIFRTSRIVFGGAVYAAILTLAVLVWLVWLLVLPVIIFIVFK